MSYMNYKIVEKMLEQIETTNLVDLKNNLIQRAIKYARIRTDWQLTPIDSRDERGY